MFIPDMRYFMARSTISLRDRSEHRCWQYSSLQRRVFWGDPNTSYSIFSKPLWLILETSTAQETTSSILLSNQDKLPAWYTIAIFWSKLWTVELLLRDTQPLCATLYCVFSPVHYCPVFAYRCRCLHKFSFFPLSKNHPHVALHERSLRQCRRLIY